MADAFGAEHAFFMVGGTSSSVQAMVMGVCKRGDKIIFVCFGAGLVYEGMLLEW